MIPPRIEPVPAGELRPLWSVMIPTFNCARYLRQTLESVLAQDPGLGRMQIEVVDDCSTSDDPESVVREVGKGRVTFYRKPGNGGAIANFNTCITRARGTLVHVLHGDDFVLPGFYSQVAGVAERMPKVVLIATRSFFVDGEGVISSVSGRVPELESGARIVDGFFYATPIQAPGVVVRRAFYEEHGGFLPALVHTADCEMWARAISLGGGVVTQDVLACYRCFAGNDTGRLARSAENLRDYQRLNQLFADRYPHFDRRNGQKRVCSLAIVQMRTFRKRGDREAATANMQYLLSTAPFAVQGAIFLREMARKLFSALWRRAFHGLLFALTFPVLHECLPVAQWLEHWV